MLSRDRPQRAEGSGDDRRLEHPHRLMKLGLDEESPPCLGESVVAIKRVRTTTMTAARYFQRCARATVLRTQRGRDIRNPAPFQDLALIFQDEVVWSLEEEACRDDLAVDDHLVRSEHAAQLNCALPDRRKHAQPCLATRIVDHLLDYENTGVAVVAAHIPGAAQPACAGSGRGERPRRKRSCPTYDPATADHNTSSLRRPSVLRPGRSQGAGPELRDRLRLPSRSRDAPPASRALRSGCPGLVPAAAAAHPNLAGSPTRGHSAADPRRATHKSPPDWRSRPAPASPHAPDVGHRTGVVGPASLNEGVASVHRRFSLPLPLPTALPLAAGGFSPRDQCGPRHAGSASGFHSADLGP